MQEITLHEALCGVSFNITHLDGRVLQVDLSSSSVPFLMVFGTCALKEPCLTASEGMQNDTRNGKIST